MFACAAHLKTATQTAKALGRAINPETIRTKPKARATSTPATLPPPKR